MSAVRAVHAGEQPSLTIEWLRARPTISLVEAAVVLGIGRNQAYEAAHRGEIPVLRFGSRYVVPTAPLLRLLGLEGAASPSP